MKYMTQTTNLSFELLYYMDRSGSTENRDLRKELNMYSGTLGNTCRGANIDDLTAEKATETAERDLTTRLQELIGTTDYYKSPNELAHYSHVSMGGRIKLDRFVYRTPEETTLLLIDEEEIESSALLRQSFSLLKGNKKEIEFIKNELPRK